MTRHVNLGAGIVYIAAFSDGFIKVGMTRGDAKDRIGAHKRVSRERGATLDKYWISKRVHDREDSEKILIEKCIFWGGVQEKGKEWISGVSFIDLVEYAERTLEFIGDDDEISSRARPVWLNDKRWKAFKVHLGMGWLRQQIDNAEKEATLSKLTKADNDGIPL